MDEYGYLFVIFESNINYNVFIVGFLVYVDILLDFNVFYVNL